MKAQLIKENIEFKRGQDPKKILGLGNIIRPEHPFFHESLEDEEINIPLIEEKARKYGFKENESVPDYRNKVRKILERGIGYDENAFPIKQWIRRIGETCFICVGPRFIINPELVKELIHQRSKGISQKNIKEYNIDIELKSIYYFGGWNHIKLNAPHFNSGKTVEVGFAPLRIWAHSYMPWRTLFTKPD